MSTFEERTHAFIVRIWVEPHSVALPNHSDGNEWRGFVEHVQSRERRYVRDLDAVTAFIRPYLELLGFNMANRWWDDVDSLFDIEQSDPATPAGGEQASVDDDGDTNSDDAKRI